MVKNRYSEYDSQCYREGSPESQKERFRKDREMLAQARQAEQEGRIEDASFLRREIGG